MLGTYYRYFIPFPTLAFWYGTIILNIKPIFSTRLNSFRKHLGTDSIYYSLAYYRVRVIYILLQYIFLGYSKTNLVR